MSRHPYLQRHEIPIGLTVARVVAALILATTVALMVMAEPTGTGTPATTQVAP